MIYITFMGGSLDGKTEAMNYDADTRPLTIRMETDGWTYCPIARDGDCFLYLIDSLKPHGAAFYARDERDYDYQLAKLKRALPKLPDGWEWRANLERVEPLGPYYRLNANRRWPSPSAGSATPAAPAPQPNPIGRVPSAVRRA
jgi:hypothetical protein